MLERLRGHRKGGRAEEHERDPVAAHRSGADALGVGARAAGAGLRRRRPRADELVARAHPHADAADSEHLLHRDDAADHNAEPRVPRAEPELRGPREHYDRRLLRPHANHRAGTRTVHVLNISYITHWMYTFIISASHFQKSSRVSQ